MVQKKQLNKSISNIDQLSDAETHQKTKKDQEGKKTEYAIGNQWIDEEKAENKKKSEAERLNKKQEKAKAEEDQISAINRKLQNNRGNDKSDREMALFLTSNINAVRTTAVVDSANCEKPEYPTASRRMEEEGTVLLKFLVGVDGKVIRSEVEKSSGYRRLDDAARTGLSLCQFKPATVDGNPEQAWSSLRYIWRLE